MLYDLDRHLNEVRCVIRRTDGISPSHGPEREIDQRHRLFLENFEGIAYQVSYDTFRPFFFCGTVERITGYTAKDFVEGSVAWNELIYPDDLDVVRKLGRGYETLRSTRPTANTGFVGETGKLVGCGILPERSVRTMAH